VGGLGDVGASEPRRNISEYIVYLMRVSPIYKKWKAYILSIPGVDRRSNAENLKVLLETHGIPTEILDGFYYKQRDVLHDLYSLGIEYDCPDQSLSLSQVGCFLSHRQAWERIREEKDPEVLSIILEDDMTLLQPENFFIDYLLEDINKQDSFHGIVLWKHPAQIRKNPDYRTPNMMEFYYQWGLCAYGITRELAGHLLQSIQKLRKPVDQVLFGDIFSEDSISNGVFMATREHFANLGRLSSFDKETRKYKSFIWAENAI